jgi:hypothetical protein
VVDNNSIVVQVRSRTRLVEADIHSSLAGVGTSRPVWAVYSRLLGAGGRNTGLGHSKLLPKEASAHNGKTNAIINTGLLHYE